MVRKGAVRRRGDGIERRSRWLGHPVFGSFVVLLTVNDHLLKGQYPGWWTGKLSDIAGVAAVATMAAVVLGRRRGLAATATAFALLKTVPGLAEVSAPFLGGVTRRDHTDLVALVVLFPLDWLLRRRQAVIEQAEDDDSVAAREPSRFRAALATLAGVSPVFWLVAAVVATSATSCGPSPAVTEVAADGPDLFAFVDQGWGDGRWAVSRDGGQTWARSAPPPGRRPITESRDPYVDSPSGPTEACAVDDGCYRILDRRAVQRRSPDGEWRDEVRLSDQQFRAISTGCAGAQRGVLRSIAVARGPGGDFAVVSLGADGVLSRAENGSWRRRAVLETPPPEPKAIDRWVAVGLAAAGPLLPGTLWLFGRRRWSRPAAGVVVAVAGWLVTVGAAGISAVGNSNGSIAPAVTTATALVGLGLTTLGAIAVARRPPAAVPLSGKA